MSRIPAGNGSLDDLEAGTLPPNEYGSPQGARPGRSMYALTRSEITRGLANRFVHSRAYILLYLCTAALSATTVVLSLKDGCPGVPFYILEVIVNVTMIGEVAVRFLSFGRAFWKYPFNVFDAIVTVFSVVTLMVIFFAGCGTATKEEEILDTLLLVARNVLQFGRLASVVRQSGQSIWARPKPIDLNAARRAGFSVDMDLPSDDESDELRAPLRASNGAPADVVFDAGPTGREAWGGERDMPHAAAANKNRDDEDMWAELG
ncbi:unnamed protein product [Peniophora sp. CBMAI 1063]|nr:unnamed protein product [Peniophora sp. CBMAI 1063]